MSHGTTSAYSRGCRCDDCRAAYSAYHYLYYRQGPTRWRGPDLIEEVTTLLEGGRSPEDIAAGLGMKLSSIARAFHRHGRKVPFPQRRAVS